MIFIGINPNNVAIKNFESGTLRMGEDILMKKLGTIGVILKNKRQKIKSSLCFSSYVYIYISLQLKNFLTKFLPSSHDRVQHIVAPDVAHKHTIKNPGTPPNIAPDKTLKNIGPGIANVCKLKFYDEKKICYLNHTTRRENKKLMSHGKNDQLSTSKSLNLSILSHLLPLEILSIFLYLL